MADETSIRVRIVQCPKCSQRLVELPDFTLYKCGGCGTTLQAKNWKPDTYHSELRRNDSNEIKARSLVNDKTDPSGFEDEHEDRSVELCPDTIVSNSQSSSPETETDLNNDEKFQESENSDYKLDDDKDTYEGSPSSLTSHDLEFDGGIVVTRDVGLESSSGIFSHEGDTVSQLSARQNIKDAEDDWVRIDSSSPRVTIYESPIDSRLASQSSPIHQSHVSLYVTSPDVENLDQSPLSSSFRRFSSKDTFENSPITQGSDRNVRDFTNYPTNGSYHNAFYGSDSSSDGHEDQSFQHTSRSRKNKHAWQDVNGSMMRSDKEQGGSELPFTSSDPDIVHRSRSPSSFPRNSLPPRLSSRPSHDPSSSEPDKIDLMRTINELKAQLRRMQLPKNNMFPPLAQDGDAYRDLYLSGACHIRREQAVSWGEPRRAHIRSSCSHCCPQEHRYSAQLPSHFMHHCKKGHCKNGHCMVQMGHSSCCDISSSLNPPHRTSSGHDSLQGCETTSDRHKYRDNEMNRLLSKEKFNNSPKKHLLPLAGGAPFVTCYYCSELLQLPTDFIIFNRRYHRLACCSCKKVLQFSLLKGTKIVRYLTDASLLPTSETGDYCDAKTVSRSGDLGRPYVRRCSAAYSEHEDGSSQSRKISAGSCNEVVEDRKMKSISRDSQNKNEGKLETVELFRSLYKVPKYRKTTSEIEERVKLSKSPLHRLMGYSSPRQVLNN